MAAAADHSHADDDSFEFTGNLGEVKCIGSLSQKPHLVSVSTSEGEVNFNPDTGADVTLMDNSTFSQLHAKPSLSKSHVRLMAYGSDKPLRILGSYESVLTLGDKTTKERVYVSQNFNKGVSLLSRAASQALGLVTLHFGPSVGQISQLRPDGSNSHPLLASFPEICEGVGCHKNLQISLPLREGAKHVVALPSRIPVNLYPKSRQKSND